MCRACGSGCWAGGPRWLRRPGQLLLLSGGTRLPCHSVCSQETQSSRCQGEEGTAYPGRTSLQTAHVAFQRHLRLLLMGSSMALQPRLPESSRHSRPHSRPGTPRTQSRSDGRQHARPCLPCVLSAVWEPHSKRTLTHVLALPWSPSRLRPVSDPIQHVLPCVSTGEKPPPTHGPRKQHSCRMWRRGDADSWETSRPPRCRNAGLHVLRPSGEHLLGCRMGACSGLIS